MKWITLFGLLISAPAYAKMQTFLRGPEFDWNQAETITTTTYLPGGVRMLRVEYIQTGCVILIVPGSGIIVNKTELCDGNGKYIDERTPNK